MKKIKTVSLTENNVTSISFVVPIRFKLGNKTYESFVESTINAEDVIEIKEK